ncbi:hypothetical protein KSP40_PGU005759 [Platanthera guangdongensis]|uniref:Uncharacterized protein n=1 Tax=Platanthera guangdongensis TaxID=2320717 RepID=A0ABR2LGU6_9ASPA
MARLGAFLSSLTAKGDSEPSTPMKIKKIAKRPARQDLVRLAGENSQNEKPAEKSARPTDIFARGEAAVDAEPLSERMTTLSDSVHSQKTATSADTAGERTEADISSNAQVPIVNLDDEDRQTEEEDGVLPEATTAANPWRTQNCSPPNILNDPFKEFLTISSWNNLCLDGEMVDTRDSKSRAKVRGGSSPLQGIILRMLIEWAIP